MIPAINTFLALASLLLVVTPSQSADPVNWPLSQAVIKNDETRIRTILETGPSQDELDFALLAGTAKGHSKSVSVLLAAGANPNRQVEFVGHSAIVVAVRENQPETLAVC